MNSFNFKTYLTSNIALDNDSIDNLMLHCKQQQIYKGDFLLRQGEKCKHSFFVESGLLKQYSIDEKGKEHIIQFAPEKWFISDRESVYFDNPSNYFIQAIEDTKVFVLDELFFQELSLSHPNFLDYNNRLLHNHIRHLQKRITQLLSATAEQRYLDFIQVYPDISLRVPQTMIASYLGITPESLSRVRKELAQQFQK
ncbi:MAG TPA: Crp/Fnr family transcriptional regulator [Chitinophagales bacterium]|nr:Crp/Fnr family transcriptional regulator [Chitinophagales bacterium]HMX60136.1 Crp/Fnr family transcriptional regulator [Chitinophagales bacterium]HMY22808.1 Crp/Fnr family transcriptional regulator [Chitinophagales bacterium]HMZ34268.1 Crp/Fnr family transcriptional regulator [Chitinophagales bacterium]HNA38050.1 Crp/Fnr family transcriptional regulator [Chitinophagales bacterium]